MSTELNVNPFTKSFVFITLKVKSKIIYIYIKKEILLLITFTLL